MTPKEFLSTEILDCLFKSSSGRRKDISSFLYAGSIATIVSSFLNILEDFDNFKITSQEYLKKLKSDYKFLSKIASHKNEIRHLLKLIEIELKVGKQYIEVDLKNCRNKNLMDLFLVVLDDNLKNVEYNKRIEILSDIFCLYLHPPTKYKKWKSENPTQWKTVIESVKKRLYRAWKRFDNLLQSKKAKQHVKLRTEWLKNQSNINEQIGDPYWNTNRGIEIGVRNQFVIKAVADEIKKQQDGFAGINTSKLFSLLKELKIPNLSSNHALLLKDTEFLDAFNPCRH